MVAQITTGLFALLFATALMVSSSRFVESRSTALDLALSAQTLR